MTREQAKEILTLMLKEKRESVSTDTTNADALEIAVELLQEPKTGHWIDDMRLGYHVSVCSNCNWRGHGDTCLIYKPKYCPNCGAKMAEGEETNEQK